MKPNVTLKIALLLLFVLLCTRFLFPSLASFSHDETSLQALVEKNYLAGTLPTHGLEGSEGVHYGPVPQWIYIAFRAVTSDLLEMVGLYTGLFSLAFLLVGVTFGKAYGRASIPAMFVALSSPWLFLYSRLAWDNSFLALFSGLIFFSVYLIVEKPTVLAWALLGISSGAALSTHLMCLPVVISAGVVASLSQLEGANPKGKILKDLSIALIAALTVNGPYIAYVVSEGLKETGPKDRWGDGRQAWWIFLRSTIFVSTWNWKYFLQPFESEFFAWLPGWKAVWFKLDLFGWILKTVIWSSCLTVLFSHVGTRRVFDPLSLFAVLSLGTHMVLLQYLDLKVHPHYFIAVWWVPFWAVAWCFRRAQKTWMKRSLGLIVIGCVATNLFLLGEFHRWVYEFRGTRGDFFPTVLGDQILAATEICERANTKGLRRVTVDLSLVRMDAKFFSFLPTRYPECAGLEFDVSDRKREVGEKVSLNPVETSAHFVITYSDTPTNSAGLRVHDGKLNK